jgi:nucleotide-binding universal stress UspA family protein
MTGIWALAALWLGLALIASLLSIWLRISTALSEIVVGTIAQLEPDLLVIGATGHSALYERTIGSRADRIIQLAPCPVLVVK